MWASERSTGGDATRPLTAARRPRLAYAEQVIEIEHAGRRTAPAHDAGSSDGSPAPRPVRRAGRWVLDHPLIAVALLALAVRLALAGGVALLSNGTLFPDEGQYLALAQAAADGQSGAWSDYERMLYTRTGSLLWPVTGLFMAFGNVTFLAQLYVVALGSAAAVLTTKLGLWFLSRPAALFAGVVVALLPSQVLWSSIVMKDALVWCLLAGIAVACVAAQGARGWRLAGLGLGIVAMLTGLGFLRLHTLEIALVALLAASLLGPARGRGVRLAGAAVLLATVPLAFGMGVAGAPFVISPGSLAERRAANAVGASTAVVDPKSLAPSPSPSTAPVTPGAGEPASAPPADGTGRTEGESLVEYAPRGMAVILLRPYPWKATADTSQGLRLAAAETLVWYPLLALALLGVTRLRGRLRFMAFPILVGGATAVMYGLTEGNVGTAYRHRGEFVWVVALLAALAADDIARRRRRSRQAAAS
jgi:hypothetical protein